jgi:uncharacterized protein (TIGR02231 family)
MPEIEPWFLKRFEPQRFEVLDETGLFSAPRKRALLKGELAEEESKLVARAPQVPETAVVAAAAVETKGPSVIFTLPKRESIPSDWQPKKAAIGSYSLPATFGYEITPRLSPSAYLRAKVKNTSETLFLSGPVQVFLEGAYVGSSSIDNVGPTEEFDFYLGVDERIRVEQRPIKEKVDVSLLPGFHGRIRTTDYEFVTKIENFKPSEIDITLIDQIPISQHDEIKVEQVTLDPKPTEEDKEKPGVYRWKFKMPREGKQEVKLSYRVTHPVDFIVEGI